MEAIMFSTPEALPVPKNAGSQRHPHGGSLVTSTGGLILLHAVPAHLTSHVRWSLENILGTTVQLRWEPQPHVVAHQRTELSWNGPAGTAAQLASALRPYTGSFYEVTERPTQTTSGLRIMHVPDLGICSVPVDAHGNFTVTEDRIRYALEQAAGDFNTLYDHLALALGQPWDDQLEPLRPGALLHPATRNIDADQGGM